MNGGRRRSLLVHIGLPKTGSTSIQRSLALLAPQLRERGVHVARAASSSPELARNDRLWFALRDPHGPQRDAAAELVREIRESTAERFVVSDERLGLAPLKAVVRGLADVAAAVEVDIRLVAYVRPQCDYLESIYAELVKGGMERLPFDLFAAAALLRLRPGRGAALDYRQALGPWSVASGHRLLVVPFERSRLPAGPAAHLLSLLGAEELVADASLRANARPGAKSVEVRRLVVAGLTARRPAPAPYALFKRLTGLERLLRDDRPFSALSARQARDLMDRCSRSNADLARACGIDSGGLLFRDMREGRATGPTAIRWQAFQTDERRAVRAFVREAVDVDLDAVARTRFSGPDPEAPLARLRARLPFGSLRWRACWLADPALLRHCGPALATRLARRPQRGPRGA